MQMRTYPICAGEAGVFVHWAVGARTHGVVEVNVPIGTPDRLVIGEAIAIRVLLFDRHVFGHGLVNGKGCSVLVHSPEIISARKGEAVNPDVFRFCEYLGYEWPELDLGENDLEPSDPLYGTTETWSIDKADCSDRRFRTPGEPWNTALGPLILTQHAIEQFHKRLEERDGELLLNPKRSLLRALKPKIELVRVELNDKEQAHKLEKYGAHQVAEHWASPHSTLSFTIIRKPGSSTSTLVSCFWHKNCQKM